MYSYVLATDLFDISSVYTCTGTLQGTTQLGKHRSHVRNQQEKNLLFGPPLKSQKVSSVLLVWLSYVVESVHGQRVGAQGNVHTAPGGCVVLLRVCCSVSIRSSQPLLDFVFACPGCGTFQINPRHVGNVRSCERSEKKKELYKKTTP